MIIRGLAGALVQAVLLATFFIVAPPPRAAGSCETLTSLSAPGMTITLAQPVAAGEFAPPALRPFDPAQGRPEPAEGREPQGAPSLSRGAGGRGPGAGQAFKNLPAFCRAAATLTPTTDSDIKIEVWMPIAGWNGKLQSVGNGGWAGSISYAAMGTALAAGYATASTDTGHPGGDPATFVLGHPEKVIDFAYRSTHEMTLSRTERRPITSWRRASGTAGSTARVRCVPTRSWRRTRGREARISQRASSVDRLWALGSGLWAVGCGQRSALGGP